MVHIRPASCSGLSNVFMQNSGLIQVVEDLLMRVMVN